MSTELSHANRTCLVIRNTLFSITGLLGLALLVRLLFIRSWNYDENFHAHLVWLVSIGQLPYRDFPINHFPLLWILFAPVMKILPHTAEALTALRVLALLLNAVFIGSLGALFCLELQPRQRPWACALFGLVVFNPMAMHYLIEFRPDPLGNAFLFAALLLLRLKGASRPFIGFAGGFCIGTAILVNPKCVLFPFMLTVIAFFLHLREWRRYLSFGLAFSFGFGASLLGLLLLVTWMHIPVDEMLQMVVNYNAAVEKAHTYGHGLANAILYHPMILAYVLVGFVFYGGLLFRQKRMPSMLGIAIFIFLILNIVTNTRPWKQYVNQWFLLAMFFTACSLPRLICRLNPKLQVAGATCVLLAWIAGLHWLDVGDPDGVGVDRWEQEHLIDWVSTNLSPGEYVVAAYPMNPVFRRDTFYKNGVDITNSGDGQTDNLVQQVMPDAFDKRFTRKAFDKELETHPPAIIVMHALYSKQQLESLSDYLERHADSYVLNQIPGTSVMIYRRVAGN